MDTPGFRKLLRFMVEDISTGKTEEVFLDSFAIWRDFGDGMLQPTESTQGVPGIYKLNEREALVTSGKRYKRLDNFVYSKYTTMGKDRYERFRTCSPTMAYKI